MMKFISFPSIEDFRHTCATINRQAEYEGVDSEGVSIFNVNNPRPVVKFTGTVKLHGTNGGVCWDGVDLWAQSRKNILTPLKDNAGFAFYVESKKDTFLEVMEEIKEVYEIPDGHTICLYGEWCGKGIQKGVGITELAKMFVIFKIKIASPDEEEENKWLIYDWQDLTDVDTWNNDHSLYFIEQFPTYNIEIDFNNPAVSQDELVAITTAVEQECPVAKMLGVEGIGEGVVWSGRHADQAYIFKVKGEKHTSSKVKKLATIDVEKLASINEFVEYAVTENRLEQGIQEVFISQNIEPTRRDVAIFLKWVQGDVMKEEMDTLVENNLEPKEVNGAISKKAVKWFMPKYGI